MSIIQKLVHAQCSCPVWVLICEVQAADSSANSRTPLPIWEVNGLAAKCSFHSRGVSCAASRAGWVAIRCSTSTSQALRVHLVHATRRDQALDDTDMFCAEFGPAEQPVPPSHRDPTGRPPAHLAGCTHGSRPPEADPPAVETGPRRWTCTIARRLRQSAPNSPCARRASPPPKASSCGSSPRSHGARRSTRGPRCGAHDGGARRSLLPLLPDSSRGHHPRHRRRLRSGARPPATVALP